MRQKRVSFFVISFRNLFFLLSFLSLSSCFKFNNTGNGEPYAGYGSGDDSGETKTHEAYLVSPKYKLEVKYHDQGLHDVSVYDFKENSKSYVLLKTSKAEKKKIEGNRVYESQDLKISIQGTSAEVVFKHGGAYDGPARFNALTYDCSDKLKNQPFAGGEGTQENPYKICTPEQLNNIRGIYLSAYFVLWSDLDLSKYSSGDTSIGWSPIGDSEIPFSGNFDGNLFSIRGLEMRSTKEKGLLRAGLFGVVTNGGVLGNVNLLNVNIEGESELGALAGEIAYARVINVQTSGTVYARLDSAGGVVGLVKNHTGHPCFYSITRSTSSVSIITKSKAGGLVGTVHSETCTGIISDSSTSGTIKSSGAGGLVGASYSTDVSRSWSTSILEGDSNLGGLMGYAHSGSIEDSYFSGSVTANFDGAGGILGLAFTGTKIKRVYSNSVLSSNNNMGGIIGRAQNSPQIENSFFTGQINMGEDSGPDIGSIVGKEEVEGRVSLLNTFWYVLGDFGSLNCIGNRSSGRCGAGVAQDVRFESYFFNPINAPMDIWDFENVWIARDGALPQLRKVY